MIDTLTSLTTVSHPPVAPIGIGLIGLGTVGGGVYKLLQRHPFIQVRQVAVRSPEKLRNVPDMAQVPMTTDPFEVVRDPSVQIVVEVMGGVDTARTLVMEALASGKHVVTANKELIAKHGPELFDLARKHQGRLLFEGAVAGGIPIIMPLRLSLAANDILEMAGILNGTTNFILTKMSQEGWDYQQALTEAQRLGFAEADPTNDVEGFDAAYKIAILSSIAFRRKIDPAHVFRSGITTIGAVDIENARALGFAIKLIALARKAGPALDIRVHPMLVPMVHPLASIHFENNALWVKGDAVGDVMFYGKGAGEMPTASAVTADILAIARDLAQGHTPPFPAMAMDIAGDAQLQPITDTVNKYYIRLNTTDAPGVIGHLGLACGEHGVSLESVMQKCTNPDGTASIVLLTHAVSEEAMRKALQQMLAQDTTRNVGCALRVL
jgi:homoserine dehydrogenase